MRHVAAYLLAVLGGNNSPSAQDVKTILASAGVDADESRLSALLKELEGKVHALFIYILRYIYRTFRN